VFALFNSRFANDTALAFAVRLDKMAATPAARIDQAYRLALGPLPAAEEAESSDRTLCPDGGAGEDDPASRARPRTAHVRSLVHELTGQKFDLAEEAEPADTKRTSSRRRFPAETRAMAQVLLILFNSNEFIYVF